MRKNTFSGFVSSFNRKLQMPVTRDRCPCIVVTRVLRQKSCAIQTKTVRFLAQFDRCRWNLWIRRISNAGIGALRRGDEIRQILTSFLGDSQELSMKESAHNNDANSWRSSNTVSSSSNNLFSRSESCS